MIAHGKKFHDIDVCLDGSTFVSCTFERCVLIFSGFLPVHLEANTISADCKWEFTGAAANTVQFMRALHSHGGGGTDLIENMFREMQKNSAAKRSSDEAIVKN